MIHFSLEAMLNSQSPPSSLDYTEATARVVASTHPPALVAATIGKQTTTVDAKVALEIRVQTEEPRRDVPEVLVALIPG